MPSINRLICIVALCFNGAYSLRVNRETPVDLSMASRNMNGKSQNEGRVAICFAGQFRSFAKTVQSAKDNLVSAFSHPDVFLFLNLQDSGKGGNRNHKTDMEPILTTLSPVSHQYYEESDIAAFESTMQAGSTCFQQKETAPCCHYSWHAPQFWAIQQCLGMVQKYESAQSYPFLPFRYDYFVRARPDTAFNFQLMQAITAILPNSDSHGATKRAWVKKGPGSDMFALLTRDAADSYGNTFNHTFTGDSCTRLPSENASGPSGAIGIATECLLYRNMIADGVDVHFDQGLNPKIERN